MNRLLKKQFQNGARSFVKKRVYIRVENVRSVGTINVSKPLIFITRIQVKKISEFLKKG